METVGQVMEKNLEEMGSSSTLKICPKCGDRVEKEVTFFNKIMKMKIICRCKKEEQEKKRLKREQEEKKDRLNTLLKNSLMEKTFYDKTFENWDFSKGERKLFDFGFKYAENFGGAKVKGLGLLFYGTVGNGKSYISFCIANQLLRKYHSVVCIGINGILDSIKETYNKWGSSGEHEIIKALTNAELLIIDDLGVEKNTEWSVSKIYEIVDSRYRNKLPLIVTTNHTIDELKEKYGERTVDRLNEICINIEYKNPSLRREKGKENKEELRNLLYGV